MLLDRNRSHLLIVDVQERLVPAVQDSAHMLDRIVMLAAAAGRLGIAVTVTEQYPKGLGSTVGSVADAVPPRAPVLPKMHFSAARDRVIAERLAAVRAEGRDQLVICGAEAHVCVLQTALDLKASGVTVAVVADAVSSRAADSISAACARLLHAGCHWVTTEMALFEWLGEAGTDDFRALSALIKAAPTRPPRQPQ
ncbi:isochorismatase family protein [Microvirga antarctica]|uniref:isochorismatase family protein n=1 Tax=Microvirga antarctica TaxID=2819233 RepID=UPI001B311EC4|nr:isochorismatase family protein [Microvirga antarctica]